MPIRPARGSADLRFPLCAWSLSSCPNGSLFLRPFKKKIHFNWIQGLHTGQGLENVWNSKKLSTSLGFF